MLDVANPRGVLIVLREKRLQERLAFRQRSLAQILAVRMEQIEGEADESIRLAIGERRLQRREVGCAVIVERDDFAVDETVGQRFRSGRDRLELCGPVEAFARLERDFAGGDAQLHTVAVELHLVTPASVARRPFEELA